ncbi:O-antigen/teichoic acid export membrane protein [Stenotrophomonas maltophilia]|uniref:oligosaccharide flippase family protein n=1 Tax=Stenotrophomonas chelatiphaga TaxID=517011 RepID=UPI000F4B783B|nr:oligosaccharide flippase family protein [Stenotrophomonas chelatiphaga]MCS4230400.1 O-antigen/teichoic acid export membrane protein [Stenotrophomonas chelatiphaga]ROQ40330.1 O-antigen/teichoic acid export membrane protein [Stenotrophomonas maltophilia]
MHLLVIVATSRASAFLAQWVMGIFLFKEDFGIIAIISIVYLLAAGFREVGLYQILQEERDRFEERAPELTSSAQLFNFFGVLLILCAAPLIASHYGDQRLLVITALLVLAMPFNIALLPYKARLAISFDFKRISRVESASVLFSNSIMAALAAVGAGIYSFVASQIALTLALYAMYRWKQAPIRAPLWPGFAPALTFLRRTKWLILSSYMNNFATRGDYLVLSLILSKLALGLYYFSYQLMAAAVQLIGLALNHLLLPLFSAIKSDRSRVRSGMVKAGNALSLMSGALCLSLLIWFPFVIHHVWEGKWDESIPLVLIVTLAVPPRLLSSPLGSSALEAMANYRTRTLLSIVDAATLVALVWIGGAFYGTIGACVAVGIQRCTAGMLFYFAAMRSAGTEHMASLKQLAMHSGPYVTCVSVLAASVFLGVGFETFCELGFVETAAVYIPTMLLFAALSRKQITQHVLNR